MFIYTDPNQFKDCLDKYPLQLFLPFYKVKDLINVENVKKIIHTM